MKTKWDESVNRTLTRNDRICELHFNDEDVLRHWEHTINGEKVTVEREQYVLKPTAIPRPCTNVTACTKSVSIKRKNADNREGQQILDSAIKRGKIVGGAIPGTSHSDIKDIRQSVAVDRVTSSKLQNNGCSQGSFRDETKLKDGQVSPGQKKNIPKLSLRDPNVPKIKFNVKTNVNLDAIRHGIACEGTGFETRPYVNIYQLTNCNPFFISV